MASTLTAASTAVFAELDWMPSRMLQAEDRAHRIGQKNAVLVHYFVVDGSIDADMLKTSSSKATNATAALDDQADQQPELFMTENVTEISRIAIDAPPLASADALGTPGIIPSTRDVAATSLSHQPDTRRRGRPAPAGAAMTDAERPRPVRA